MAIKIVKTNIKNGNVRPSNNPYQRQAGLPLRDVPCKVVAQLLITKKVPKNPKPVESSINGYRQDIFLLQPRHFPFRRIKENKGILSYQAIFFLQCGQNERPLKTLSPLGAR